MSEPSAENKPPVSAESKPPEVVRCWNCWAAGHNHKSCNSRPLNADAREYLRMRLKIPLPKPSRPYIDFLKAERCYNCWALCDHTDKFCPRRTRTIPEREALRIRLNVPPPAFWRSMLAKEDVRQMTAEQETGDDTDEQEEEQEEEEEPGEKSEMVMEGLNVIKMSGGELFILRMKQIAEERIAQEQGTSGDQKDDGNVVQAQGAEDSGPSAEVLFRQKLREAAEAKAAKAQKKLDALKQEDQTPTPSERPPGFLPPHLRWKKKDNESETSTPTKIEEPITPSKVTLTPATINKADPGHVDNLSDNLIDLNSSPLGGPKMSLLCQTPSVFWDLQQLTPGALEPLLKPHDESTPTPTPDATQIKHNITYDSMEGESFDCGAVGGAVYENLLDRLEDYQNPKKVVKVEERKESLNLLDMDDEIKGEELSMIEEKTVKPAEEANEEPQYGETDDGGEVLHFVLEEQLAVSSIPDEGQRSPAAAKETSLLRFSESDRSSTTKKLTPHKVLLADEYKGPSDAEAHFDHHDDDHRSKESSVTHEIARETAEIDGMKALVYDLQNRHTGIDRSLHELVHLVKQALPEVAALKQLPVNNLAATSSKTTPNKMLEQINTRLATLEYNQSAASSVLNTILQTCQSRLEFLEDRQSSVPGAGDLLDMINHLNTRLDSLEVDKRIPLPPTLPDEGGDTVARGWIFPEDNMDHNGHHRHREHRRRAHRPRAVSPPEDIHAGVPASVIHGGNVSVRPAGSVAPQQRHGGQDIGHGGHSQPQHPQPHRTGGGHAGPSQIAHGHRDRGQLHLQGNIQGNERGHHRHGNVPPSNQVDIGMRPQNQTQATKWANMHGHRREEILDERHAERRGKAPKRRVRHSSRAPE